MFGSNLTDFNQKFQTVIFEKIATSDVSKEDHPSADTPVTAGTDNSDMGHGDEHANEHELHEAIREAIEQEHCEKVLELIKKSFNKSPEHAVNVASIARQELKSLVLAGKIDEAKASEVSQEIDKILGA